ncbi:uncharacterized protein LOC110375932 [Helicoverpa armigera]|uniref:Uncharacterized protein n=1 Tax=Helicoverpa armigera TaxID=29058 RepID=A0A2W1C058_HELAM|nr:uncharacterized protein LOC110375932 [Helicoverpa armigera]XP_047036394.1 uncharacterized protein LOC124642123 [Helicoverpa zea]PZC78356.1 hypothetical protein B5X24_HaOG202262 [Helicoverpa armigera]
MYYQTLVLCCVALASANEYQDALKKLWSKNSDSQIDVTSASIVIKPSSFETRDARIPYTYKRYAFKPRAIPLRTEAPQVERNVYYADVKNKSNILFPGNYIPIAKEKSNLTDDGQFQVRAIPLIRRDEFERRSLDVEEPIIEKPEGFSEATISRRSLSYIMGEDEDEEDEFEDDDDGDFEEEDVGSIKGQEEERHKNKRKKKLKPKKLKKYMLPLLLAYKMKYFALVPVMIAGLVLLIGATGLAGFFFALFAAVMGLQKGGY